MSLLKLQHLPMWLMFQRQLKRLCLSTLNLLLKHLHNRLRKLNLFPRPQPQRKQKHQSNQLLLHQSRRRRMNRRRSHPLSPRATGTSTWAPLHVSGRAAASSGRNSSTESKPHTTDRQIFLACYSMANLQRSLSRRRTRGAESRYSGFKMVSKSRRRRARWHTTIHSVAMSSFQHSWCRHSVTSSGRTRTIGWICRAYAILAGVPIASLSNRTTKSKRASKYEYCFVLMYVWHVHIS